jgi:hypothetical protein
MIGGFCGIAPHLTRIKNLRRGDHQKLCGNVCIVLFRDDWIDACWDEYADVEMALWRDVADA